MAFITPKEADDMSRNEKSKPETKEEVPGEDSDSESEEGEWGIERRRAQRHLAQREAHLLFIASRLEIESHHPPQTLIGYTRDLSETGLSLMVTSTHSRDSDLCGVGGLLRVKLSLPSGVVEMNTRVVRSEWRDEDNFRQDYFIGVQITEISVGDRLRYTEYLHTLG
ncbi:MAG: hypothetical protein QOC96_1126 [Acidobacteriota bacterium]|jgi:hypothetical protein|nr:hypothetical protein [Acidobacteriota bacterium]